MDAEEHGLGQLHPPLCEKSLCLFKVALFIGGGIHFFSLLHPSIVHPSINTIKR